VRGPPSRHPDESREQLPAPEGFISDAAELIPGVRVVYPNQGVCAVVGLEEKDIAGQKLQLIRMRREEDGAAVLVPRNKVPSIGLRRVATGGQIEGVFHYLAAVFDDPELDWKIRHRDNADRLIAGGVLGVAEVVKGLHALSRLRPLPAKEREQYDNARHLLVHEVAVAVNVPPGVAEDFIDYALMPPEGVKFDLKPPPTPVLLPQRVRRRKPVASEDGDLGDLGLGDLGIDLDLDGALPEVPAEGEAAAEGGEETTGAAEGAETTAPAASEEEDAEGGAPEDAGSDDDDEDAPRPSAGTSVKKAAAKPGKKEPAAPADKAKASGAARKAVAKPAASSDKLKTSGKKTSASEKAAHKDRPAARPAASPDKPRTSGTSKKATPSKPAPKRGAKKK